MFDVKWKDILKQLTDRLVTQYKISSKNKFMRCYKKCKQGGSTEGLDLIADTDFDNDLLLNNVSIESFTVLIISISTLHSVLVQITAFT